MKRVLFGSITHIHLTVYGMSSLFNVCLQSFLWSRGTILLPIRMDDKCTSWDGSPRLVHERQLRCYVQRQKLGHLTRRGMLSGGWERGGTGNRKQTLQSAIDFTFALFCLWCCLCLHKDSLRQEMQGGAVTAIRGTF